MANKNIPPGPGRPKGLRNKVNATLEAKLLGLGCDPAIILGQIATDMNNRVDVRERAATTLMKYIYAVKKDVVISQDNSFEFKWAESTQDLAKLQGVLNDEYAESDSSESA